MVGGAYILGTAEAVGRDGIIWTVVPICYNIGMLVAAFCVAPKMRVGGYTTIFDPLQNKYGKRMGAFLFVNELLASVFLEAAILGALGSSLVSIIEVNFEFAVVVSASVAVTYTFIGGLYSVSYTDIIQICFLTTGLILVTPFVCLNDAVDLGLIRTDWTGTLPTNWIGHYIDLIFVCICGGIPWAGIHQVVLASKSLDVVRKASLISAALCMCLIVPPSLVGLAGAATGDRLHDVEVTVAEDDLDFNRLCGTFKGPGTDNQLVVMECPQNTHGRYVKLQIVKGNNNILSLCDVKVIGV
ncbi:hypothetical protein FSP39_005988 [Pinctada imbricata]|uniref:Uncharacterized protein n=1 Tax=Pinctada imbricata TaxID=66713 RepID=A0AA88XJN4_PINIB|nr:hypothetical protein FSP39_005988 [Pinctada imbricata]